MSGILSPSNAAPPLVIGGHLVLCALAFQGNAWLFGMGMLTVIATEFCYARFLPDAFRSLAEIGLGLHVRSAFRTGSVLILATGLPWLGSAALTGLAAMLVGGHALRRVHERAADRGRELRRDLVETRNLELPGVPGNPPRWLAAKARVLPVIEAVTVLTVTAGIVAGRPLSTLAIHAPLACAGLALGVQAGLAAAMSAHFRRVRRLTEGGRTLREATRRVVELEPEVALYFAGQPDTAYQVNMWLSVLERSERSAVVILRERELAAHLGATSLPVICVPETPAAMALKIPTLRAVLYPANTKKNMDMLRNPALKHVFIGHGDSDKVASFNPVSRVFDEIWVAGPAGRERYRRARVGVDDEKIIEVGRPQLSPIRPGHTGNAVLTVLYAPTWEGWVDDLNHTSVPVMGARLIEGLLGTGFPIRIIYKPHPMAGRLSARLRAGDRRIRDQLAEAGPDHQVVAGPEPTLYDCFNRADLLVNDVSSVIADFLASGRPYVVTNIENRDAEAFRAAYPTTEAAYLLGPDCEELPEILSAIRGPGPDRMAPARATLRDHLLGRPTVAPQTRFNDALASLIKRGAEGARHEYN